MKLDKLLLAVFLMGAASCTGAFAENMNEPLDANGEAVGVVREFGQKISSKVGLVGEGSATKYLCRDSFSKSLSRLVNLTVKVGGEFDEKNSCITGKSFEILKMPSGRDAIVGNLKSSKEGYLIEMNMSGSEESTKYKFRKVPKGLSSHKGKKVVLDAVPVSGDAGFYKIVTYMKHPEF